MRFLTFAAFLILLLTSTPGLASEMTVYKDPSCGCCGNWIKHIEAAGHTVKIVNTEDMERVKKTFGVPEQVQSCHTALVDGYVIEGHVPAARQGQDRRLSRKDGFALIGQYGRADYQRTADFTGGRQGF